MIIFGTRGVKSTMTRGTFHCPQCNNEQHFAHKKVTRFFTLYFIPVIPLGRLGEYVECQTCRQNFIPRVLEQDPSTSKEAVQGEYEKAVKHALALITIADGDIREEEVAMVHTIVNKVCKNKLSVEELKAYIAEVQQRPEDITTYLERIAPVLNEHGKEVLIKCALHVSASDGNLDKTELALIIAMTKALQMSPSHVRGILTEYTTLSPASQN